MELEQEAVLLLMFGVMLAGILVGIHIGFAFGVTAFFGNVILFGGIDGDWDIGMNIALRGTGRVAY